MRFTERRVGEVDVVVVGSGPVGCAAAAEIVRRNPAARVLIVEVGPRLTAVPGVHLKNLGDPEAKSTFEERSQGPVRRRYRDGRIEDRVRGQEKTGSDRLSFPGTFLLEHSAADPSSRARERVELRAAAASANVGGMGVHWTCACPTPGAFERIPFIDADELDENLAAAREYLQVTAEAFVPDAGRNSILERLRETYADAPDDRRPQPMPLAAAVDETGGRTWSGPADIVALAGSAADRITLRAETLARCLIWNGGRVRGVVLEDRPTGDTWVVSAKQVVVAADALRTPQLLWASGIRPPALGRYLNDHTWLVTLTAVDLHAELEADGPSARDPLIDVLWLPLSLEHPYHGQIMRFAPDLSGVEPPLSLGLLVPKDISFEDAVTFSDDELDTFGMPLVRIDYSLNPRDDAAIESATREMVRLCAALGDVVDGAEPVVLEPGSSLHYMGTHRIGQSDDGGSVCDRDGRVWGFENLFLGGNGAIPTPTGGNPTLTSVALVIRAARQVAAALTVPPSTPKRLP